MPPCTWASGASWPWRWRASALFTLAAQFGVRALSICTISDNLLTRGETSATERQETFSEMIELALDYRDRLSA